MCIQVESGVQHLKVLFVTREYPPFEVGGVAVHTFNLVKNLTKLGVSCKVLSFGDPEYSNAEVTFIRPSSSIIQKSNSSATMDLRIPVDILRITQVANNLISNERFDVVHVEEPYVGAFVKHKRKVTTVHDTSFGEINSILHHSPSFPNFKRVAFYGILGFYLELMCMSSSSFVLIPSEQVKTELLKIYGVSKEKLRVVRNGVELPVLFGPNDKGLAKKRLGLDADKTLIFTAARHIARKRLDTLIHAIKLLRDEGINNYTVVIAGDGPIRSQIMNLSEKQGLGGIISFSGWISRETLSLYYEAADVFVLTSDYESGPISLLEAMSYGDAIISSKIQGFPSLMRDGFDGLLFQVGDYHALSYCLKELLDNPTMRLRLSTSARSFAERFDWKCVAEETVSLYAKLF